MLMYDPPNGWLYGFPKPYKPQGNETIDETLLRDGYPQAELDRREELMINWYEHSSVPYEEMQKLSAKGRKRCRNKGG